MLVKVTLREKKISKGRSSLYLDFYPAVPHPKTEKPTRREFLKMYVIDKPKNPFDKQSNKQNRTIAESIRQKKQNYYNKPEIYLEHEKEQLRIKELGEKDFVSYFKDLCRERTGSNYDNWTSALNYLNDFTGGALQFKDIDKPLLEKFKKRLLEGPSIRTKKKPLSQNSAKSYFDKVKAALKQAYQDGILQTDINKNVKGIAEKETHREFLFESELNLLVKAPCKNEELKKAALFSALTGLRHKNIANLTWSQIQTDDNGDYAIAFEQAKSESIEHLPISDQAYRLLGTPNEANGKIFKLQYSAMYKGIFEDWLAKAGIDKKISFHNFRHTYATLTMANGASLSTVSKMLGHKNIKTTQVYAKVVDQAKREAANNIKLDL